MLVLVRFKSTVLGFLVILRPIAPDSVQACGHSGRRLPDPSSYSAPCLVQQQIRFTRQRFLYAVFVFPSHGKLSQHEVLFYMVCPTFSLHSLRYWYFIEKAIFSKFSFCRCISSRQQRQPPSYRPCLRGMISTLPGQLPSRGRRLLRNLSVSRLGHCSRQQDHLRGILSLFIFPAHPSLLLFTSMWHDGLFLFTALFVCAFFVRDRTSTTMHGTSRSTSRCRTFGVTTHSKLIRMSSIGIWVCHTSHEVKTPWMSRSYIHGACESIATRSGARFVQGVRCTDL